MERLFTFGCSFTNYIYPTWADILGIEYDVYDNWALSAGGNHLILYSLSECIARHSISKNDTVYIMWTSLGRDDKFVKDKWVRLGSVHAMYDKKTIDKYIDPTGYLLTNFSVMHITEQLLKRIGCKYRFFKIMPFELFISEPNEKVIANDTVIENEIYKLYEATLNNIEKSVLEVVFNNKFPKRRDLHPTPLEHCLYLQEMGFDLTEKQLVYAHKWDDIITSKKEGWMDYPNAVAVEFGSDHLAGRF
jgi:hypothetical protein